MDVAVVVPLLPVLVAFVQNSESIPATLFDRVVQVEITANDPPLIEGRGPTRVVEYEVEFDGTLHVWTKSQLDLFLEVDDAAEAQPLASDDNSGGATTPYLRIMVEKGDWLMVLVAGRPGDTGSLSLHMIAEPKSDATRAALTGSDAVREANRLHAMGDFAGARAVEEAVIAALERTLPEDHPDLLDARANLVVSMYAMGDLAGARALGKAVLAARERTLPEDHPRLLLARSNLAVLLREMGDLADARALFEAVLAGYERTLPEDHPNLLTARSNLASSMSEMGDLVGAHRLHEAVLAGRERTLPEDHPDIQRARVNLAVSMRALGDLAGGRALEEMVLAGYEGRLPEDHPDLLRARLSLAGSMYEMGDLAGARALYEAVLAGYERTLPEDHPHILRARSNLAVAMHEMGDLAGARALYEAVLASRERTLPEDHPDLLAARANLASSMSEMGDLDDARTLYEEVLAGFERTLPEDHPDLLRTRALIAISMSEAGDFAGSRALLEGVLAARERTLLQDNPDVLRARANLAVAMYEMGDLDGARALLPRLVAGMRARVLASLTLAPRQARQKVGGEDQRHAAVLFLSESGGSDIEASVFELTETMRLVAGEAARSLVRLEGDPGLASILDQAADVRRALNDLVAGAARDGTAADELASELTTLALRRDRLESEASSKVLDGGVVTQSVRMPVLLAALGLGDAAVGYRRIARWSVREDGTIQVGEDHLFAHVLSAEGGLARVDLGLASELEELVRAWRTALGVPLVRGVGVGLDEEGAEHRAGRRLQARILDPVLAAAPADTRRLFVCADDLVFLVPLDTLPLDPAASESASATSIDSQEVVRVGDRYRIVSEVSFARLLAPQDAGKDVDTEPSLLVFGGVDYDAQGSAPSELVSSSAPVGSVEIAEDEDTPAAAGSRSSRPEDFQMLLQSRFEAEATGALFEMAFQVKPTLLTGKGATKAALFEAATGKRYLHLATHGWFAPEGVRSTEDARPTRARATHMRMEERVTGLAPMTLCGLALAGANRGRDSHGQVPGILTAEELCSLDLAQCELAVLSACETNVGIRRAGQGIQSLQTALYAAGARTSITSLWKVDDAATRRLFEVFYTKLWKDDLGKADALWQAKMALRAEGYPVRDWGGWVLTGGPD